MCNLSEMYIYILDNSKNEFPRVFELLADPAEGAALFHCTVGKDRTGIVAALLLHLAGVAQATIIEDYALTATFLLPIMDELCDSRPKEGAADLYEQFFDCNPRYMETMLQYLQSTYGSAENYLATIDLSQEKITALKQKLLKA